MPSAVVCSPSARLMLTIALTILASSGLSSIFVTKERSILMNVEIEFAQMVETQIAGAEIVERYAVISAILPVSSAMEMKASGTSTPLIGCCQRARTSNPTGFDVVRSTSG